MTGDFHGARARRLCGGALALLLAAGAATMGSATIGTALADEIHGYGPGGPTPAMREVAAAFEAETGHRVAIVAGPAGRWMEQARADADFIYSGSENMMSAFVAAHGGLLAETIEPLYLRPSAILVRKGNPKGIAGLKSLLEPGVGVMVVQGAGQVGMWEDAVGRLRDIDRLRAFRDNIVFEAPNSGVARMHWLETPAVDAWLIWNHWQIDNPELADLVPVEPELAIYRDTGVGLTEQGAGKAAARDFVAFLTSPKAREIFAAHGWQERF